MQNMILVDASIIERVEELNRKLLRIEALLLEREQPKTIRFLRLPEVLERMNLSKTTWWQGVQDGIFPGGVKHGNARLWLESDIDDLMERMARNGVAEKVG